MIGITPMQYLARLRIRGSLDFKEETPQYNLSLLLSDCNPRSLGAGLDIDDPATVSADIRGPLYAPVIDGTLKWTVWILRPWSLRMS